MDTCEGAKAAGNAAWTEGNIEEAIRCFSQAINLGEEQNNPALNVYYSNRCACFLKQDNASAALLDAEKCTTIRPEWAKGWSRKGQALLKLGRLADAAEAFTRGISLDPTNDEMRKGLLSANKGSSDESGAPATGSFKKVVTFIKGNRLFSWLFVIRSFMLTCFIAFLLPFFGSAASRGAYKRMVLGQVACSVYSLYSAHGRPERNMAYMQKIMLDPAVQDLFTAFLFFTQRPYFFGVLPMVLSAFVHWLWFFSCLLQVYQPRAVGAIDKLIAPFMPAFCGTPNWSSLAINQRWASVTNATSKWVGQLEVAFGVLLMLELFLPRRNIMMVVIYWQLMRMRVMLELAKTGGAGGRLTDAFKTLHKRMLALTSARYCPSLLALAYIKASTMAATIVQPPTAADAQQAQTARPKCSIM